jgi:uncharacterized DUF497 family protein
METGFTWDPAKAERNKRDHGISFEMAREAFADPNHIVTGNYHFEDEREQRYLAIGMTKAGAGGCSIRRSQRAGSRDHSHHFRKKGGGV